MMQSPCKLVTLHPGHNSAEAWLYFNSIIDKLGMEFKTIEVYFVVPENRVASFNCPSAWMCPYDIKVAGLDWK